MRWLLWSESADSATSSRTHDGASDDAAGVPPADGRRHLARAFGVVRELPLDDTPARWLLLSLLKASDSDSLKEEAASDSFLSNPRGRLARAGFAGTVLVSVLFPPSADTAADVDEDKVIGVADDAPPLEDMARSRGEGRGP